MTDEPDKEPVDRVAGDKSPPAGEGRAASVGLSKQPTPEAGAPASLTYASDRDEFIFGSAARRAAAAAAEMPKAPAARASEARPLPSFVPAAAPAATPEPPPMIDLTPVQEAMKAVAEQRPDAAGSDKAKADEAAAETKELAGEGFESVAPVVAAAARSPAAPEEPAASDDRIGVLLVNLGTPDAATARGVRRYLREFLSDPRVIEKDTLTWRLVLKGIILPFRPRIKARAYRKIWNRERNESPLKTITRSQAEKLAATLAGIDRRIVVDWAMRYGNPSIGSRLRALIRQGCERILVMPLYPQYSGATTASVCDETFRVLMRIRNQPSVRIAPPYPTDPAYIDAVADSIRAALAELPFKPEVILASFHGMPLEYVEKGDPYYAQCVATTDLLRDRLGLDEGTLMLTFQSRFGRAKWLEPYTDETLKSLAKKGVKDVAVVTPGFSADCLETLEEIALENAHLFKKRGGTNYAAIPCLNDSPGGMAVLAHLAERELKGWV